MQNIYPFAQIVHLMLAIIFLGYIFFDVIVFNILKKKDEELFEKVSSSIKKRVIKIMPLSLLFIILTGGMMMPNYVNHEIGYFSTTSQQIFMLKVTLACLILIGVIYSLGCKFLKIKTFSFMKNFHTFALICGFFIVLFAKLMLYV